MAAILWNRYGDERKLANSKRLAAQRERCATKVSAFPWQLILETHGGCRSTCALGATFDQALPQGELEPADVDRFLSELWPYLVQVNLSNHGNGFLNPRLPQIIARIHARNVGTIIQSDLAHFPEDLCRSAIDAGLDLIVASIDGASHEEAARFRRDGLPDGSLGNLARLVRLRDANPDGNLRIVWRAVCYSHHTQEIQRNRELARAIGVDDFVVVDRDLLRQFRTIEPSCNDGSDDLLCSSPWELPAIHFDGTLMPCGLADDMRFAWGDLKTQPWVQAYNTPQFQQARHLSAGDSTAASPCLDCWKMKPMRERISRGVPLQVLQLTT